MNMKRLFPLIKKLQNKLGESVSIDEELWIYSTGRRETGYVLWLDAKKLHFRFKSYDELVSKMKEFLDEPA